MTSRGFSVPAAIAAIFALLFTLLTVQPATAAEGTINGIVTDQATSNPLQDVEVLLYASTDPPPYGRPLNLDGNGNTLTRTSQTGFFEVTVPDVSATYHVCFWTAEHTPECFDDVEWSHGMSTAALADVPGGGTAVASLAPGRTISGKTLTTNGTAVAGAEVFALVNTGDPDPANWPLWSYAVSTSDGSYTLPALPQGEYIVCANHSSFITWTRCYPSTFIDFASTAVSLTGDTTQSVGKNITFYKTPGGMHISASSKTSVTWNWDSVTGVSGYDFAFSSNSGMYPVQYFNAAGSHFKVYGLTPGHRYYAKATGHDGYYLITKPSVKMSGVPGQINRLRNTTNWSTTLRFDWSTYTGASRYQVQLSSTSDFKYVRSGYTTNLYRTFSSLTKGKKYYVRVRAQNSSGTSITPWAVASALPTASISSTSAGAAGVPEGTQPACSLPCSLKEAGLADGFSVPPRRLN